MLFRLILVVCCWVGLAGGAWGRPNVVIIYADDVGYGDFGCYGGTGVETPEVDRLAREGVRFLSGYSSAATCTPSRFSLLTGSYGFRNRRARVLPGNAPLIIDPEWTTLPSMLRDAGYRTGFVGKWHLGLGTEDEPLDWNGEIAPGPRELGFDYSFHIAATADRVPSVYIENGRVVNLSPDDPLAVSYAAPVGYEPKGESHPELLRVQADAQHSGTIVNGVSRIGTMSGGKSARFVDEEMADDFLEKALEFIEAGGEAPFFLYFAMPENHVPRLPHPRFLGASSLGPRGDAIAQFDWSVGRVLDALERAGLAENTLVILTSDNGPVLFDGYRDGASEKNGNHRPAGPYRGGKYSVWEGGTRAPLIVRWPGEIAPGISDALISQVDFMASIAGLLDIELTDAEQRDGMDLHRALLGQDEHGRPWLIQEGSGQLAVRTRVWKYIPPGQIVERPGMGGFVRTEIPEPGLLFNLVEDPGETRDLSGDYPGQVERLRGIVNLQE